MTARRTSDQDQVADLEVLVEYIEGRTGLSFAGSRRADLMATLGAAVQRAGARTARALADRLEGDESLFGDLAGALTVDESFFFRHPAQLDLLRREVIPEVRGRLSDGHVLGAWSAGSATGEEAYTLAILLEEEGFAERYRIVATDLSQAAVEVAQGGVYTKWSLRAVTPEQRRRYFTPAPGGFRVDRACADRINFRTANLLDPAAVPGGPFDLVLCRNVLIYFTPGAIEQAARQLTAALAPGGWLLTAPADPPLHAEGLELVRTPLGSAYRRSDGGTRIPPSRRTSQRRAVTSLRTATERRSGADRRQQEARAEARPRVATPARAAPPPSHDALAAAREALTSGDYGRAAETAAAAIREHADDSRAHALLVRALANAGRLADALAAGAAAIARFPLDAELRYLHAVALLEAGQAGEAAEAASTAVYLQPDLAVAHLVLGRAQRASGDADAARRSFRNARVMLRSMPQDERVPFGDGEVAGRLAAVAEAYERLDESTQAARDRRR